MNERIKKLALQAGCRARRFTTGVSMYQNVDDDLQKFAELIIEEHLAIMQQEWYALNDAPAVENESPRDVGFRVGKKSEINALMAKIRRHFGVEE